MKRSIINFLVCILIFLTSTSLSFSKPNNNTRLSRSEYFATRQREKSSRKLFYESKKLLDDNYYWECSRNLISLLDAYPRYSESDEVTYQLGECLYEMELLNGAKKVYTFFTSKYSKSPFLGHALAGLQRVAFDEQDYKKSINIYKIIMKGNPAQEVVDYSSYYAGLAYYQLEKFKETIFVLSLIKENSPYYDHGLYMKGLSLLKLKKLKLAIEVFNDVCILPVYDAERITLINEAHLTLGYLYYELGYYIHARKHFTSISREYEKFHNVLLISGWTAIKLEQYKDAVIYLTEFITDYPETDSTPEGLFLLGRCYLKLGLYDKALQNYEYLIDLLPESRLLAEYNNNINRYLDTQLDEIANIEMSILVLEGKFMKGISLDEKQEVSVFIKEKKDNLNNQRRELLYKIRNERKQLNELSGRIKKIQNIGTLYEQRKDWRSYAEYGKSRAIYLVKKNQMQ